MGYRLPDEKRLRSVLAEVVESSGGVRTLGRLADLVGEALARDDPRYRVSRERLRRVAVTSAQIRVQIHTRRSPSRRLREACPVCGSRMKRLENQTLSGTRVVLEARCPTCPYWTGRARRIPTRYVFQSRHAPDDNGQTPKTNADMSTH